MGWRTALARFCAMITLFKRNKPMNPVAETSVRKAEQMRAAWPSMTRRQRRAGARWWWRNCQRTADSWPEQWRAINANSGVVVGLTSLHNPTSAESI
jgi:hypothetical protein